MVGDDNYKQTEKVRDWIKSELESNNLIEKQRESLELSLAILNAMLEVQALPHDPTNEEFLAKAKVVEDLQQRGLELGLLIPGPSKR